MIPVERRLTITGTPEDVVLATHFITAAARGAGLDETAVHHCTLAVDEACTNIVEHGYHRSGAQQVIDLICRTDEAGLTIRIYDDSPPFDPLTSAPPPPPPDAIQVGGLGVSFIKQIMTTVSYEYVTGRNCLTLFKAREAAPAPLVSGSPPTLIQLTAKITAIVPQTPLQSGQLSAFDRAVGQVLERGVRFLVIDLAVVERVDTAGVKSLVAHWQRARELKGELVLSGVRPAVREAFQIMGLDLMFTLLPTPDAAIAHFDRKAR